MKTHKWLNFVLFDILAIFLSVLMTLYIFLGKFDFVTINLAYYRLVSLEIIIYVIVFRIFGLYQWDWAYAGINEMVELIKAISINFICLAVAVFFLQKFLLDLPFVAILINWMLIIILVGGNRLLVRYLKETKNRTNIETGFKRVLIAGAGDAGVMVAREMGKSSRLGYKCVGFVDDDSKKYRQYMVRLPVLGYTKDIPSLVRKFKIDEIIISIPSATGKQLRRIVELCERSGVRFRTLPGIHEIIDNTVSINQIRNVEIEDLLGREQVEVDLKSISSYLNGAKIMVTGGGGSIGSEICRQVVRFNPSQLLILGKGENSIYQIELELRGKFPALNIVPIIADVRDKKRIFNLFNRYRPEVVFHAAAHKHVPLMEINPEEAFVNNVIGTNNMVEVAVATGTREFVMISTDKAVNPTNVMGATKRIAEMVVQAKAMEESKTKFVSVRFGNVLDSRGSVVPLFRRQIAAGGPVTVTHPEVKRYFMTIPEAVQLVIQAGSFGNGGETFVLDMGEPVKIIDLARDLIRLSGLKEDEDIDIKFVGLRPGEKLFEEILTSEEGMQATRHKKIFITPPQEFDRNEFFKKIERVYSMAENSETEELIKEIKNIVSEHNETEKV